MNLEQLLKDNYTSTVARGLITPSTSAYEFIEKLKEEVGELEEALVNIDKAKIVKSEHFAQFNEELADVILVALNAAKHFDIDILKELENKVKINKKRIQ